MSIVFTKLDVISSTKMGNLLCVKIAPIEFVEWLKKEMSTRTWGIRETAQRAELSHPTISDIVTNGKQPSFDTVLALSKIFNQEPVNLLRAAGLLPPVRDSDPLASEAAHLVGLLPEEQKQVAVDYIRFLVEMEEKKGRGKK